MNEHTTTASAVYAIHVGLAVMRGDWVLAWYLHRRAVSYRALELYDGAEGATP